MVVLESEFDAAIRTIVARQHGVITAEQAHRAGIDVRRRLARGEWQELFHGVYHTAGDVTQRALISAGLLAVGSDGVAVEDTAAALLGLPTFNGCGLVHVAVPGPAMRHFQDGLIVRQVRLPDAHRITIDGLACTTSVRTVADSICVLTRADAVALVDAALHRELIMAEDLEVIRQMIFRRPGCVGGRRHLAEADGRARSPAETRLRLICHDAGIPPESLALPVPDRSGTVLGHAALAWPTVRVAALVDQLLECADTLAAAGWRVLRFTSADAGQPAYVVSVVRAALTVAAAES